MVNLTKRSVVMIVLCLAAIGTAILLSPAFLDLSKQKGTVNMRENDVLSQAAIPPIDAAAPTNTETATFALG